MIAEDENDIRMLVATMCQVWGHTPLLFESGQKAWEFLESIDSGAYTSPLPQFALMDIRMPGHWGNEVAKRIRETKAISNIPIILMTAFVLSDEERATMMRDFGVDRIINKPLPEFMELKRIIDEVIAKKSA